MSRNADRTGTKSIQRKARKTPRYRAAILRMAYRENGQMADMPRKLRDAVPVASGTPLNDDTQPKASSKNKVKKPSPSAKAASKKTKPTTGP